MSGREALLSYRFAAESFSQSFAAIVSSGPKRAAKGVVDVGGLADHHDGDRARVSCTPS
jgi:hypothetical protein